MRRSFWFHLCAGLFLAAGLLVYSQTDAFAFDEGFHLLAAQLIRGGQRPYLDFLFAQTPLNAYWNAFWMGIFGDTWRVAHAVAALQTAAAAVLTADYILRRMPERRWAMPAAVFVACAVGFNVAVVQFGTIAQAYGLCLLLCVAAFRVTVPAVDRRSLWLPALGGLLSVGAAASSLLCAPVAPVLLIWILIVNAAGNRLAKAGAFLAGGLVALIPLLRLFAQSPRQVVFDVFKYHALFRQVEWSGALQHDLSTALGWIDCGQALLLTLLAAGGFLYVWHSDWDRRLRAELYLCVCLAAALTVHLFIARPTFPRYFLLTVPFMAIVAAVGLRALSQRLSSPERIWWTAGTACLLMVIGLTRTVYDGRDDFAWRNFEKIAAKAQAVTPAGASLYADEALYFMLRRTPPPGFEYDDSHKLKDLPPAEAALLHIVPSPERDRMVKEGAFHTAQSCDDDEMKKLEPLYANQWEHEGCGVYWDFK